jgi:hypothetical protein
VLTTAVAGEWVGGLHVALLVSAAVLATTALGLAALIPRRSEAAERPRISGAANPARPPDR